MATPEETIDAVILDPSTRPVEFRENEDHARFESLKDLLAAKKIAIDLAERDEANCKFRSMFGG
jgi:hypothetical protein